MFFILSTDFVENRSSSDRRVLWFDIRNPEVIRVWLHPVLRSKGMNELMETSTKIYNEIINALQCMFTPSMCMILRVYVVVCISRPYFPS